MNQPVNNLFQQPLGSVSGLIAACLVILYGAVQGFAPFQITLRAAAVAISVAVVVRLFVVVLQLLGAEADDTGVS